MNFIAIVGTNSSRSTNRKLLQFIAKHFADQANIKVVEIADIPAFNEPKDTPAPKAVTQLAKKIEEADGVITALLSPVMGATGAISTVITQLGETYVSMGIPAEVVHRVVVIAGGALNFAPQSGAVITFNAVSGLNFKHGFIHACILSNVGFIISLIAVILAAQLLY